MAFQPFGYRFQIRSPKSPEAVKLAIRAKKVGWFEPKTGPRGWIAGPVMCLWNSAFDRHGPMVIARIERDGHGSRIRGRAGSDLNGLAALAIMAPIIVFLLMMLAPAGSSSPYFYFLVAFFGLGIPATFWWANSGKREADPLVRFIRRATESRSAQSISKTGHGSRAAVTARIIDEDGNELSSTGDGLTAAIQGLGVDGFVIVEREEEHYMQVLSRREDYLLEKREGAADQHYQVCLPKGELDNTGKYDESEREIIAIMTDYLFGVGEARRLNWTRTSV